MVVLCLGLLGSPEVTAPPTYANGLVITGMANGDMFIRGRVVALDAKTGDEVWRLRHRPGAWGTRVRNVADR